MAVSYEDVYGVRDAGDFEVRNVNRGKAKAVAGLKAARKKTVRDKKDRKRESIRGAEAKATEFEFPVEKAKEEGLSLIGSKLDDSSGSKRQSKREFRAPPPPSYPSDDELDLSVPLPPPPSEVDEENDGALQEQQRKSASETKRESLTKRISEKMRESVGRLAGSKKKDKAVPVAPPRDLASERKVRPTLEAKSSETELKLRNALARKSSRYEKKNAKMVKQEEEMEDEEEEKEDDDEVEEDVREIGGIEFGAEEEDSEFDFGLPTGDDAEQERDSFLHRKPSDLGAKLLERAQGFNPKK